jgi:hypothetical protein
LFTGPTCPATPGTAKCPEPLCTLKVLPLAPWRLAPRQRALPLLHRSYELMRQSQSLIAPRFHPCAPSLCRLLSAPAGRGTFPTLSLRIFPHVLGPLLRLLLWCIYPFLPTRLRPSLRSDQVGAWQRPYSNFSTASISELQSFTNVQARGFARHPGCSHRCVPFQLSPVCTH